MPRAVLHFLVRVIIIHISAYFISLGLGYQFFIADLYEGSDGVLSHFFRSPEDRTMWAHVTRWVLPAQILRGFLIGLGLLPFYYYLKQMKRSKRFLVLLTLFVTLGLWAASSAGPGTIEGLIHIRPDVSLYAHLIIQPSLLLYTFLTSLGISMWMGKKKSLPDLESRD
jgi:hypothetical protein